MVDPDFPPGSNRWQLGNDWINGARQGVGRSHVHACSMHGLMLAPLSLGHD